MDSAKLVLGDPWLTRALQGPSMVQIGLFLKIDLLPTYKLKFTAWFEVSPTFGSVVIRY